MPSLACIPGAATKNTVPLQDVPTLCGYRGVIPHLSTSRRGAQSYVGGVMRSVLRLAAGAAMAFAVAGCNLASEGLYFREGIGTNLSRPELPEATQIQDLYIAHICQQAGLSNCDDVMMGPQGWSLFVEAGMNDVDLRCDAYLAWLDNRKRSATPILNQLAAMNSATQAIMNATGAGAAAITIVGLGFGLAADTFTNVNSRLLLEVNQSTVQSVVLGHQTEYRLQVAKVQVRSRPMAIYLLRNYLRICMPFSIETSINNTVSVYHRAGPEALRSEPLSTRAPRVAAATSPAPRVVVRSTEAPPITPPPVQTILGPIGPFETALPLAEGIRLQEALCVDQPSGNFGVGNTRTRLREFNSAVLLNSPSADNPPDNIATSNIRERLRTAQRSFPSCQKAGFANGFELGIVSETSFAKLRNYVAAKLKAEGIVGFEDVTKGGNVVDPQLRKALGALRQRFGGGRNADLDPAFYRWIREASVL